MSIKEKIRQYYRLNKRPPTNLKETTLSKELALILGARWEIEMPYSFGRCDCLSQTFLIECKKAGRSSTKGAIGQLLCYAYALRFRGNLGLGLISDWGVADADKKFCKDFGIYIFWYNTNTYRWTLMYEPKKKCQLHLNKPSL